MKLGCKHTSRHESSNTFPVKEKEIDYEILRFCHSNKYTVSSQFFLDGYSIFQLVSDKTVFI